MTTTTIKIEAQSHRVGTSRRNDAECCLCGRGKPYDAGYAINLVSTTSWPEYDSATTSAWHSSSMPNASHSDARHARRFGASSAVAFAANSAQDVRTSTAVSGRKALCASVSGLL